MVEPAKNRLRLRNTACNPTVNGNVTQGYLVHMLDLEVNEWVLCAETTDTKAEIRSLRPGHLYR